MMIGSQEKRDSQQPDAAVEMKVTNVLRNNADVSLKQYVETRSSATVPRGKIIILTVTD